MRALRASLKSLEEEIYKGERRPNNHRESWEDQQRVSECWSPAASEVWSSRSPLWGEPSYLPGPQNRPGVPLGPVLLRMRKAGPIRARVGVAATNESRAPCVLRQWAGLRACYDRPSREIPRVKASGGRNKDPGDFVEPGGSDITETGDNF